MLERYIIIDIDQMISDYDDNKTALRSIEEQYEDLCEKDIGSIDYSKDRVQTTPEKDVTLNLMIRKQRLKEDLKAYRLFFSVYDPAWEKLTDDEKFILMSFVSYRRKQEAIDRICERFSIEVAEAYRRKNSAANRFRRMMFG